MKSLSDESARSAVILRLSALASDAQPAWGRLTAPRMLCHAADTLRMALGELPTAPPTKLAFTRFPLKQLLLYIVPMARNLPTAPELLTTAPDSFEADRERVAKLIQRFADTPASGMGPRHPFFGPLSWPQWAALQWRHLDHHLRQFGV